RTGPPRGTVPDRILGSGLDAPEGRVLRAGFRENREEPGVFLPKPPASHDAPDASMERRSPSGTAKGRPARGDAPGSSVAGRKQARTGDGTRPLRTAGPHRRDLERFSPAERG